MKTITYFHRNIKAGFSINKVTQTVVSHFDSKREYYMPSHRASILDLIKNTLYIFKHRDKNGINHITGDIHYGVIGLIGCKSILTVHDTVFVDYNKYGFFKKKVVELLWFRLPLKFATKIVCISEATKDALKRFTSRKDIIVIHNSVDSQFKYVPKDSSEFKHRILFIGTSPNKNLERTAEALKGLNCHLRIVGRLSDRQADILTNVGIEYSNVSGLTDDQMIQEYIDCDIVSFISEFEGFGMPIIEANKVGRPVITSTIPVLREVGGDSCIFVNPYDVEDIRNGFVSLLKDSRLRAKCVESGLKNVERFSVKSVLNQWLKLYQSVQ